MEQTEQELKLYNTALVVEHSGATARQINHWCIKGYLKPTHVITKAGQGSGSLLVWTEYELNVAWRMAQLVNVEGYKPEMAAKKARGPWAVEGHTVEPLVLENVEGPGMGRYV